MIVYHSETGILPVVTKYDTGARLIRVVNWSEGKVHHKKKRAIESHRSALKSLIKECEAELKKNDVEIFEAVLW